MKYRVVGWTDYESDEVPETHGCIGFAERNAIIDEIRKNGYLFSGWEHQESWDCVPILNDGKKRTFSQRGWGGLMAEAYGHLGSYDYAAFTFHPMKNGNLPNDSFDMRSLCPKPISTSILKLRLITGSLLFRKSGTPSFWMIWTRFGTLMPRIRSHFDAGIGLRIL